MRIVYPSVEVCIYCGAKEGTLTDEHIMPFGLGGDLVLPKSSCAHCSKTTAKFENFVLRSMFGKMRSVVGVRTRRPKQRPSSFSLELIMPDKSIREVYVPLEKYPFHFSLLRMPEARILRGLPPQHDGSMPVKPWAAIDTEALDKIKNEFGAINVSIGLMTFQTLTFSRFLAKIAHAFARATETQDYVPLLGKFITGIGNDPNYFCGTDPRVELVPSEPDLLFQISVSRDIYPGTVTAFLQFFPRFNSPIYHVVVGIDPSRYRQ